MAWEERARGGRYYVRKRRIGGRVVSEYVGGGAGAMATAHVDEQDRRRRDADRQALHATRRREEALDVALDEVTATATALTTAVLLMAGCHTHKRTWRRQRDER